MRRVRPRDWRAVIATAAAALCLAPLLAQDREREHSISFLPSASDKLQQGYARIVNRSAEPGEVAISAIDDTGRKYGPLTLAMDANETVHLDSDDLETGNPAKDLTGSTGPGQGDWRLALDSDLDIEALAYIRTEDGFLTAMHDIVPATDGRHRVPFFNPGSNHNQVSLLRLVNTDTETAEVSISGIDDAGTSSDDTVVASIPAAASRTYSAQELESGGTPGLAGQLGDGAGKWQLIVESGRPLVVMSLLSSPTGHLTNLSFAPDEEEDGVRSVPFFPQASDPLGRQGFVRVINHSAEEGEVTVTAFDGSESDYEPISLAFGANRAMHFNSNDLEFANASKGLSVGVGAGQGDWRLELTSELDIEVLSYIRTDDGFVTPMHHTAARALDDTWRYYVPIFHPASQSGQESHLRLASVGDDGATSITIRGLDDQGLAAPEGDVGLALEAGRTRTLTAGALELGAEGVSGRLGTGSGKWQLFISADGPLEAMSLEHSSTGYYENLSRGRNGYRAWPLPSRHPDLVVDRTRVNIGSTVPGGTITLSTAVRNQGDAESATTTLRYFRSPNATISTSDTQIGTDAVGALAASGASSQSISLAAPADPGTTYYGACVDGVSGESDTTNNCSSSVAVTVEAAGSPDLVVEAPSASDDRPDPGMAFTLSATVRNQGDRDAGATTLRYYRSADATISTGDTEVGTHAVGALAASGASSQSISLAAPADPGTTYYGACVDGVSGESDITNNCSSSVAVTVEVAGSPDLVVEAPSASDDRPDPGMAFTLSATVRNQGDRDAGATTLRYYRSADATISTGDTEVGTHAVGALAASGASSQSIPLAAPADPGTTYYGACVDGVSGESDITNNCSSSVEVTVEVAGSPDLVVEAPSASDDRPDPGMAFTLSATVRNQGDRDAGATTLRYYRSADATISTGDTEVGTHAVGALAASGASSQSIPLAAPADPGTTYYGACVDGVSGESDITNNCSSSVEVTVEVAGSPDLIVEAPSASDDRPRSGVAFTLSATVRNQGGADAMATTLRYYRSSDATITTADAETGSDALAALAVSAKTDEAIELVPPSAFGIYYYGACVDAVTGESNTRNNCSSSVRVTPCEFLAVGCGPDAKQSMAPDLLAYLGDLTIHAERVAADIRVLNWGAARSAATKLSLRINVGPTWSTSLWAEERNVPAIDSRSGVTFAFDVPLDDFDPGGHYYARARAQPVAGELRRSNADVFGFSLDDTGQVVVRCASGPTDDVAAGTTDPLLAQQWHLNNLGQRAYASNPGTPGEDLGMANALTAEQPLGQGVRIAVADTGLETCHPDLADNIEASGAHNFNAGSWNGSVPGDPFQPSNMGDHGTSVAGIAASVANNGVGGRGVAPGATLHGYNVLSAINFWPAYVDSMGGSTSSPASATADIFNMSFGTLGGASNTSANEKNLFQHGVRNLRAGRGAIYVKSAGNGFGRCHSMRRAANDRIGCASANADNSNNLPYFVLVGGFNASGVKASYASAGSNLWVSAPAGELGSRRPAIITTDQVGSDRGYDVYYPIGVVGDSVNNPHGNYVSTFHGTSSAAPNTSGAVAVLLQSYPALTWRDVKHILAKTARQIHAGAESVRYIVGETVYTAQLPWITNAGGYRFHNWYGFGAVDVDDALAHAASHTPDGLGTFVETAAFSRSAATSIPDADGGGTLQTLTVRGLAADANIEAVMLRINITHPMTHELGIHLTSPSGTESILNPVFNEALAGDANLDWSLLSNAFYGESPNGEWTLKVVDAAPGDAGRLNNWNLRFALGTHP